MENGAKATFRTTHNCRYSEYGEKCEKYFMHNTDTDDTYNTNELV